MSGLVQRIARQSVGHLIRIACVLALVALAIMVFGLLVPRPLNIIVSMSVGHAVGVAAAGCYLLAILLDVAKGNGTEEEPDEGPGTA